MLLACEGFTVSVSTIGCRITKLLNRGAIKGISYTHKQGSAYSQAVKCTHAKRYLQQDAAEYPYPVTGIQVDNGSEYMGHFKQASTELGISLSAIPPRSPKWNADVEHS